jgi:hypothetical protein
LLWLLLDSCTRIPHLDGQRGGDPVIGYYIRCQPEDMCSLPEWQRWQMSGEGDKKMMESPGDDDVDVC